MQNEFTHSKLNVGVLCNDSSLYKILPKTCKADRAKFVSSITLFNMTLKCMVVDTEDRTLKQIKELTEEILNMENIKPCYETKAIFTSMQPR